MEMVIAVFVALIVVLALGRLILANQRAWEWGRDKAELQQNVTEGLEWMARSVRAARTVEITGTDEFRTYDENGSLVHTFQLANVGSQTRLLQDGSDLVDRRCTLFQITANSDTTSLTLEVELEDNAGNRVAGQTRVTIRNRTFTF
jgi:hypothetical protein